MRILQVYPYFYPAWKYGGVTRVVYDMSKHLADRGHEVTVYTTDALDEKSRIKISSHPHCINGVRTYYFKNLSNYLAYKHNLALPVEMFFRTKKEIKEFNVIHLHGGRTFLNMIVHHYAKKYGIPYVVQAHGALPRAIKKQSLKKIFDLFFGYKILKDASKVIALTKTEADQYKKMGVDEDKIEIVPNGIDLSEYDNLPKRGEFRKKYRIKTDEKIVLYLGRIHVIKGIDLLLDAFSDLANKMGGVKLVIAGPDDGFLSTSKAQIEDLKIGDRILFTGPLYETNKLEAYVDADVYVLPSVYEIFGVTVLEACACGTPVIVTDRCGIFDLVEKVGYVVEYDKEQLRDAVFKMLSDDGVRRRFGEEGRRLVREEFGWGKIVNRFEEIYLNLMR